MNVRAYELYCLLHGIVSPGVYGTRDTTPIIIIMIIIIIIITRDTTRHP